MQGTALHPVPFSRKVVQALASASIVRRVSQMQSKIQNLKSKIETGTALGYPLAGAVPFSRKVVQTLASASIV